jgi:phage tail sheath protein FI
MTTLVSPGVSVTLIDESFYVPASAPTVPLFFVATRSDKKKTDGISDAMGAKEASVVRTITSLNQSVSLYGVPFFRVDNTGASLHGDARNEYGLFALNQFLSVGNRAYVVRADVDLADDPIVELEADTPVLTPVATANGTLINVLVNQVTGLEELWTLEAVSPTTWNVTGSLSGTQNVATTGVAYNNGIVSFTIVAGSNPYVTGDIWEFNVTEVTTAGNALGANDAARRVTIATALQAEINSNQDVRSEYYEYNLILCPGYPEVVDEMLNLNLAINEEAFVIADTPFNKTPEDTAIWSLTIARQRSQNVGYYYPHAVASNLDGVDCFVAASGVALKTFAHSDNMSEVWFPPAGLRRGTVVGVADVGYVSGTLGTTGSAVTFVSTPLNQGQRDVLYEFFKNVNPIVFFPGRGIVIWGQKTSYASASAFDRINVMRLLQKIKRDLRKASMSYVFEINDQITRDSIKLMIDSYLGDILTRRGLYDYAVLCDSSNNTPARIDRNELWVDIALKPAKAIEFIYIPIRVLTTGAQMPDVT